MYYISEPFSILHGTAPSGLQEKLKFHPSFGVGHEFHPISAALLAVQRGRWKGNTLNPGFEFRYKTSAAMFDHGVSDWLEFAANPSLFQLNDADLYVHYRVAGAKSVDGATDAGISLGFGWGGSYLSWGTHQEILIRPQEVLRVARQVAELGFGMQLELDGDALVARYDDPNRPAERMVYPGVDIGFYSPTHDKDLYARGFRLLLNGISGRVDRAELRVATRGERFAPGSEERFDRLLETGARLGKGVHEIKCEFEIDSPDFASMAFAEQMCGPLDQVVTLLQRSKIKGLPRAPSLELLTGRIGHRLIFRRRTPSTEHELETLEAHLGLKFYREPAREKRMDAEYRSSDHPQLLPPEVAETTAVIPAPAIQRGEPLPTLSPKAETFIKRLNELNFFESYPPAVKTEAIRRIAVNIEADPEPEWQGQWLALGGYDWEDTSLDTLPDDFGTLTCGLLEFGAVEERIFSKHGEEVTEVRMNINGKEVRWISLDWRPWYLPGKFSDILSLTCGGLEVWPAFWKCTMCTSGAYLRAAIAGIFPPHPKMHCGDEQSEEGKKEFAANSEAYVREKYGIKPKRPTWKDIQKSPLKG